MPEPTAWPDEPLEAVLIWPEDETHRRLHFADPEGNPIDIYLTDGDAALTTHGVVWHVEREGDYVTVSPAITYEGHWRSPEQVRFRLVDCLEGECEDLEDGDG